MKTRILLLSIFGLGFLARFINLSFQSLHCDEAYIILLVRDHSIQDILASMIYDPRPPLYYLILHFWLKLFGSTHLAARSLTALFGCLTIFPVYFLAKKYFNTAIALLAAALFALSPFNIYCAQMVKEISLYVFFGSSGFLFFTLALDKNKFIYWALFVLCSALAIYFHYAAGLLIIAAFVYLILIRRKYNFVVFRNAIFAFLSICLVYLPGFWFMFKNLLAYSGYIKTFPKVLEAPTAHQLAKYFFYSFSWFIKGEGQCWAIYLKERSKDLLNIIPLLFLAVVFINPIFLRKIKRSFYNYLPILTALFVPIVLEIIAARTKMIYFSPRHIAYVSVFLLIIISASIVESSKFRRAIIIAVLTVFMLVPNILMNFYQQEPWQDSLDWLRKRYSSNDIIGLSDPMDTIFVSYYDKAKTFSAFGISYVWDFDVGPDRMVPVTKENFETIKDRVIKNSASKKSYGCYQGA